MANVGRAPHGKRDMTPKQHKTSTSKTSTTGPKTHNRGEHDEYTTPNTVEMPDLNTPGNSDALIERVTMPTVKLTLYREIHVRDEDILQCGDKCAYLKPKFYCTLFTFHLEQNHQNQPRRCRMCLHAYDTTDPGLPKDCHDCGAKPGECHKSGCDTEMCSICGGQWISCGHENHDPQFARWSGWWPGKLEAMALGIDLNTFHSQGWAEKLFVKPQLPEDQDVAMLQQAVARANDRINDLEAQIKSMDEIIKARL